MTEISLTVAKLPYSKAEILLFKFLPKSGAKISSAELVSRKKKVNDWSVTHPRNNVTVTMRNLMEKVRQNREGFSICQSERRGPHPVEYWIETRKPR